MAGKDVLETYQELSEKNFFIIIFSMFRELGCNPRDKAEIIKKNFSINSWETVFKDPDVFGLDIEDERLLDLFNKQRKKFSF